MMQNFSLPVTDPIRRQDVCDELMVMDATLKITSGIYSGPPQRSNMLHVIWE